MVGSIFARVMADHDGPDGHHLEGVTRIGVDEVSFAKGQKYLTVVVDPRQRPTALRRRGPLQEGRVRLLRPARRRALTHGSADRAEWIADAALDPFRRGPHGLRDETREGLAHQFVRVK
jgi:transposase